MEMWLHAQHPCQEKKHYNIVLEVVHTPTFSNQVLVWSTRIPLPYQVEHPLTTQDQGGHGVYTFYLKICCGITLTSHRSIMTLAI